MKKTNLVAAFCILFQLLTYAQDFPGYGIVSNEEINLKQCSFDKEANAVVLLHEAVSDHDDDYHLITKHHVRIKILNEKGFSAADISIPFYRKDNFEQITGVEGMTINGGDGHGWVETKLERKSIFTQKTNERFGEVIFTFPAIKSGSIVDYLYTSTMKHYGGLDDWDFQERLPVISSKYTLIILPNMQFAYGVSKAPEMAVVIKELTSRGGVYFEMNNIPGLGDEPYMDARRDYLQKVIFQLSSYGRGGFGQSKYMTSWDEVTRELMNEPNFGGQLGKDISGTGDFIKEVKAMALPEEKMKAVFNFVQKNVLWNGLYSKYAYEGVKNTWQKKTGTSGDINLLLVNLLKEASLEAYPMLVSERFHGRVDKKYPFIDQFNSVFACVIINNVKYFLDATDKSMPAHLTPFNILNTTALVVNRKAGGLVDITNDNLQFRENIIASLDVSENGTLSGDITVNSRDYARVKKLEEYRRDKDKFLATNFVVDGTDFGVKDLEVNNIDNDSLMLEQKGHLSGNLNTAGDFIFLPLNLFTGFNKNPFLGDTRFSNINFGYKRVINLNTTIQLPAVYTADEIPKSVRISNPGKDIVFIRQIEYDKQSNYLRCMVLLEFKKSIYDNYMYPVVKEMYEKMLGYLKEPIVLKKK
jgi:hypothetical protein